MPLTKITLLALGILLGGRSLVWAEAAGSVLIRFREHAAPACIDRFFAQHRKAGLLAGGARFRDAAAFELKVGAPRRPCGGQHPPGAPDWCWDDFAKLGEVIEQAAREHGATVTRCANCPSGAQGGLELTFAAGTELREAVELEASLRSAGQLSDSLRALRPTVVLAPAGHHHHPVGSAHGGPRIVATGLYWNVTFDKGTRLSEIDSWVSANGCAQAHSPIQLVTLDNKIVYSAKLESGRDAKEAVETLKRDSIVESVESDSTVSIGPEPGPEPARGGGDHHELHVPKLDSIGAVQVDPFGGGAR